MIWGSWLGIEDLFDVLEESLTVIVLLVCVCIIPLCAFARSGDRQRREAGGSRLRLWAVSLAATGLTLMPLAIGWLVFVLNPNGNPFGLACGLCLSIVAGIGLVPSLQPPGSYGNQSLPLVTDAAFLSRMSELASRMNLRVPTIRVLRSANCDQQALAGVGGLPQPSLVVSDGILHRLDPVERDTIAAHEMAHIVNGSLWVYVVLLPLACSLGVVAHAFHVITWLWMIPALHVGVRRILDRRFEYDCDLRAARAVGFPETATALTKIHKIGWGIPMTWPVRLLFATEGHPALANRLAHLARFAPSADRPHMPVVADSATAHSRLAWFSACAWLVAVMVGWRLGQIDRYDTIIASAVLLTVVSLTPRAIRFWIARQHGPSLLSLPRLSREAVVACIELALIILGLGLFYFGGGREMTSMTNVLLLISAGLIVTGIGMLIQQARRLERRNEFDRAWNQLDFATVVAISAKSPSWLAKDANRQCTVACAKAALGRCGQALADLEQLDREGRLGEEHLLYLGVIQIEVEQFEQALRTAERIKCESPPTGVGESLSARVLRRLGRFEEARQQLARVLELSPDYAAGWAAAAGIEIELGNFDQAREFLARAQNLEPGTPQELAESARLALRTEPPAVAKDKLQRAIAAYESNPLMLRPSEVLSLQAVLATLDEAGTFKGITGDE